MKNKNFAILAAAVIAALPLPAAGYTFLSGPLNPYPVAYSINAENCPADFSAMVHDAFHMWTRFTDFDSVYSGETDAEIAADRKNVFQCRELDFFLDAGLTYSSNAVTYYAHYVPGRRVLDADVIANNDRALKFRTVLHEVGHLLGLGHSADPESVMYPRAGSDTLTADDIAGINDLFSRNVDCTPRASHSYRLYFRSLSGMAVRLDPVDARDLSRGFVVGRSEPAEKLGLVCDIEYNESLTVITSEYNLWDGRTMRATLTYSDGIYYPEFF